MLYFRFFINIVSLAAGLTVMNLAARWFFTHGYFGLSFINIIKKIFDACLFYVSARYTLPKAIHYWQMLVWLSKKSVMAKTKPPKR